MNVLKKLFPICVDMRIAITDESGLVTGTVTYSFPAAEAPSPADFEAAFLSSIGELPDGFRVMTRHEHFLHLLHEKTGQRVNFALPPLKEDEVWHDPEAASAICTWYADKMEEDDD